VKRHVTADRYELESSTVICKDSFPSKHSSEIRLLLNKASERVDTAVAQLVALLLAGGASAKQSFFFLIGSFPYSVYRTVNKHIYMLPSKP